MNTICIILYISAIILGIIVGLIKTHNIKKDFPEFFSPLLADTDIDFSTISTEIVTVNSISDSDLTFEYFVQSL